MAKRMGALHLQLLGQPGASFAGAPLTAFHTAKTEALLDCLAATGRPHRREALACRYWGDMPAANAKRSLTQSLSFLRGLVAPYLVFERQTVVFNTSAPHTLDTAEFRASAAAGRAQADLAALKAPPVPG